jgi:predicted phage-related endonuclease
VIEQHPITDKASWLELRKRDVTGSHLAALVSAHEYKTALELWHHHIGSVPMSEDETPAMERGALLEDVAIRLIAKQHPEWRVTAPGVYLRDPEHRLGGTPDCLVETDAGRRVVEIKCPDYAVFKRDWLGEDGSISPPMSAVIQAVCYRHLLDADFAMIGVLRVGRRLDLDLVPIDEPPNLWPRLVAAVDEFWRSVESGVPPEPTFPADADLVLRLAGANADETTVDLTGNNELPELAAEDASIALTMKTLGERRKSIKAQVLHAMGPATVALINGRVFATANVVQRKAYTVAPCTYRDLRIKGVAP